MSKDTDLTAQLGPLGVVINAEPLDPGLLDAFGTMVETVRRLQDAVIGARPGTAEVHQITELLSTVTSLLGAVEVPESRQIAAKQVTIAGRLQTLVPVLYYHESADPDELSAEVTFGRFYLGSNNAAHGGSVPLVFDEIFGRLTAINTMKRARTAYLNVNFRSIALLGKVLQVRTRISRVDGRKVFLTGTIHDGDTLVADAEGLFVTLRPGQI